MIKKIFKALLASIELLIFGVIISLFANWLYDTYLVLAVILTIFLILLAGWLFTNT